MARNSVCKKTNIEGGVQFDFADGKKEVIMFDNFPIAMQVELGLHGIRQKFGDSYADSETVSQAVTMLRDTVQSVQDGNWNRRVVGIGLTDLATVIAELTGHPVEESLEQLKTMDDIQVKALKKRKDVSARLARIKADRLASVDVEEESIDIFG